MERYYTDEINAQIVIALLKEHGIRKVVASPGTTNMALVVSVQHDSFFTVYSCVDERSAAYMACGLAVESGEPVVISCTGATASRNYAPGLTEAFYRKLPVLAITSTQDQARVGHYIPQVIDRSVIPNDVANLSVHLQNIKDEEDRWDCEIKVNRAILALKHRGGGPVHINLSTRYSKEYGVRELPKVRAIRRVTLTDNLPPMPSGRVAIFIGSHREMSPQLTTAIDNFCAANDAVAFCDHTSGYHGKYRVLFTLPACQNSFESATFNPEVLIHIGEVSGDYYTTSIKGKLVWRVSEDGELRDPFKRLRYVFEMPEQQFFERYTGSTNGSDSYLALCHKTLDEMYSRLPDLPFSNPWLASQIAHRIPPGSTIHFGILNSLRSWNFFELPESVTAASNVGGFGIDGALSTVIGASLHNPDKLYFAVVGDLAFFYDMNSLGNRHVGKNLRILLVNNGKGTEFRQYKHVACGLGDEADEFVAAAGHFGQKSTNLVRHYAEDLGFEYMQAATKEEFLKLCDRFLTPEHTGQSMIFEVFTDSELESEALETIMRADETLKDRTKELAKQIIGKDNLKAIRKIIGR